MKLVHKIILANTLGIISIILVAAFSYHEFDLLLAKLRFVEIADSLNASFLQMRLSEKNYFLYKDDAALPRIRKDIQESYLTIESMRPNIIKAIGDENFEKLQLDLKRYEETVAKVGKTDERSKDTKIAEKTVREAGRTLRLFSERMVRVERQEVNNIISASKRTLLSFFGLVIFVAIMSSYLFFSRMFRNLRRIERTANSISDGNFANIEGKIPKNELGSAMAAINAMCEELKTGQEQLIQSRKLASLGTLTAGVAHELGNPLNNISMVAQTYLELLEHLSEEDKVDYVKTILEESERIRRIVQDLLDFSRTKERNFRVSDINDVVRRSLKLVQNMLDVSGIETKLTLQDKLPPVFIDEDKIREVLVNLLTNATYAMSAGDTVWFRTNLAEDKNHIVIEIEDTGKGIPSEFLAHIFDPFFSTKGTEGTGLGLSISYGIIKKHKGTIVARSTVGIGTTFTIELPVYTT
ncbi:MAG: ATP-binding protein [Desulfatiglandaceae bacterium]|jgi:signal transduction histidine kinase